MFKSKYRFKELWEGFGMPQKRYWWCPFWIDLTAEPRSYEIALGVIEHDKKPVKYIHVQ